MKIEPISILDVDVSFDFTTDCDYWPGFWERNDGLGAGKQDPDIASQTLRQYHQALWSRDLPCGKHMILEFGGPGCYLMYGDMELGSDSITTEFRNGRGMALQKDTRELLADNVYETWMEEQLRLTYTMGGMILFPRHRNSLNQMRGFNAAICDRWDLTLECIRRYYLGIIDQDNNPLGKHILNDKAFFDLFVDFKGYCDFFFLQDCVTDDYQEVKMLIPTIPFKQGSAMPKDVKIYLKWMYNQGEFLQKRNARIKEYIHHLEV